MGGLNLYCGLIVINSIFLCNIMVDEINWGKDYPWWFTMLAYIAYHLTFCVATAVMIGKYIYEMY